MGDWEGADWRAGAGVEARAVAVLELAFELAGNAALREISRSLEVSESRTAERKSLMEAAESSSRSFSCGVSSAKLSACQPSRLRITGTPQVP